MKVENFYCDIEGCEKETEQETVRMQVIFTTSQTDGAGMPRHFTEEDINICETCLEKILKSGKYIIGSGAQGYNTYLLKE